MVRYLLGGGPPLKEQTTEHCPYFSVVQVEVRYAPASQEALSGQMDNRVALENIGIPELIFCTKNYIVE